MANVPGPELETNDEGVPLLYERALVIYDYMLEHLEAGLYDDEYQFYKGSITTELETEFGITSSQYTRAMDLLKAVEAVEQVNRSNSGSSWALYYRPSVENFESIREEQFKNRRRVSKQQITDQRIHDLTLVVADLERRVVQLERKLDGTD